MRYPGACNDHSLRPEPFFRPSTQHVRVYMVNLLFRTQRWVTQCLSTIGDVVQYLREYTVWTSAKLPDFVPSGFSLGFQFFLQEEWIKY